MKQPCPCGSARPFDACCGRYLADFDGRPAPDAQALMRSRYCAYVLRDSAYLLATWHPATRPATLALDATARWLGLEVRSGRPLDATHAEVEFVARCRSAGPSPGAGRAVRIHERSRFVKENGRWYYVDGDML